MSDSDDDDIPALDGMVEQVGALRTKESLHSSHPPEPSAGGEPLRVATTTVGQQSRRPAAQPTTAIKRGFFDAKPSRRKATNKATAKAGSQQGAADEAAITVLKARSTAGGMSASGKQIPDFLRVEPGEEEKKLNEMKEELIKALKPTEETVQGVMNNPELLAGFDDPEVMAAVDEIAKDPQAMKKYQNNAKIRKFYEAMGMYVGNKLENIETDKSAG